MSATSGWNWTTSSVSGNHATGGVTSSSSPSGRAAVRVHDLRHTGASLLLARGVDARTITETLGHGTLTTTPDTCAHVRGATLRATADGTDDALGSDDSETGSAEQSPSGRSCAPAASTAPWTVWSSHSQVPSAGHSRCRS
ncbi:tyrosine-type recombinase/integrase [Streptomyces sp. NPDC060035]|uniref:tyrosine-type recombinase/integrase n=1 Tax=Streptomyces sp. NPDC060035 TaxID=3347044 RepID=UPI0036CB6A8E